LHRPDYVRAPKIQKPSVARVIVRAIRNGDPPGRFLRKDEKSGKWVEVGDKKAAEKTSQALREKTTEEREKTKGGDGPEQGIMLPGATNAYLMENFPAAAGAAAASASAKTEDEKKEPAVAADADADESEEKKTKEGEEQVKEKVETEMV